MFRVLSFCAICLGSPLAASEAPIWQFDGQFGPDYWSKINSEYELCARGKQQSPIDIADAYDTSLYEPEINWAHEGWEIANTGNMVVMRHESGGVTALGDARFQLSEILFRQPAEHLVDGHRFDMEVQFVHQMDGEELVLSVFLRGDGQLDMLEAIVGRTPLKSNKKPAKVPAIDLAEMLPDLGDLWIYRGSMTKPPCSEGVLWLVFMDPVRVSNAALLAFDALQKPNARPIQPLYGRFVLTD